MTPGPRAAAPMPRLLQLHLLVVLLAFTAILGRLIGLPAPALVAWRTALAALGAAAWLAATRRGPLVPPRRALLAMLGVGLIVGCHWMCFFGSIQLANVSVALAGFAATSLFTGFTEPWLERRRVRPFEALLGGIVLAGLLLVAGTGPEFRAGLLLALAGAFLAAVFPVLNRMLVRGHHPLTIVTWEMVGACAVCLALLPWAGGLPALLSLTPSDVGWLLVLAWVCTVLAHGWTIRLLRSLSAYTANLAINFEPVYGMLLAAWIFREHHTLTTPFYLGAAAIVLANLLHPLVLRRARRPP